MSNWVRLGTGRWLAALMCATMLAALCTPVTSAQCELDKLLPPDRLEDGDFGYSVALDGSYLLVGMPRGAGAAYLFDLIDGEAHLVGALFAEDGEVGHDFGAAVAIEGELVVIGAWDADHRAVNTGAVYVFHRDQRGAGAWGQAAKLVPSDGRDFDRFGVAVAVSGDTIVVGSSNAVPPDRDSSTGTAYVFQHDPGDPASWTEVVRLDGTFPDGTDHEFGAAVDIDSDTVIVGDWLDDVGNEEGAGSAYIFERHRGGQDNWGEVKKLTAALPVGGGTLGYSVSIHGNTVIAGSPFDDNIFYPVSGSAYIFERDHGGEDNWGEVQKLTASDMDVADGFGGSVSIHGDRALVGALGDSDDGGKSGSAYIFKRAGVETWSEVEKLTASDAQADDWFGWSVALSDGLALVSAMRDDQEFKDSGSAYVFDVRLGDIDGDCLVGPHDLILMLGAWGDCPVLENCHSCHIDLDGDCLIGTSDLLILLGNWG